MAYQIQQEIPINRQNIELLTNELSNNATSKKALSPMEPFAFYIRDENNNIIAGCNGFMYYGCVHIDQVWVAEKLRRQGYGTKLMQTAENYAKEKNCLFATLVTMDFEAPAFYKKLGYYIEFERHGYLQNSVLYMLRKPL